AFTPIAPPGVHCMHFRFRRSSVLMLSVARIDNGGGRSTFRRSDFRRHAPQHCSSRRRRPKCDRTGPANSSMLATRVDRRSSGLPLTCLSPPVYFALQSELGWAMRDLDKALADITAIRSQMARGSEFRGYGPATVAATAALAIAVAVLQAVWLPAPATNPFAYAMLWGATAVIAFTLIGIEMVARTRRIHSGLADEMIHAATGQFIP